MPNKMNELNEKSFAINTELLLLRNDVDNRPDGTMYYIVFSEEVNKIQIQEGPYFDSQTRDEAAKELALTSDVYNESIFWLDITPTGTPFMDSYANINDIPQDYDDDNDDDDNDDIDHCDCDYNCEQCICSCH